jgi:hypothetical protein
MRLHPRYAVLLPGLLLCGCVSVSRGREFPIDPVEGLDNMTSKSEAMGTFGEPLYRRTSKGGGELWVYQHAYKETVGLSQEARTNQLTLEFNGDELADYEFVTYLGMPSEGQFPADATVPTSPPRTIPSATRDSGLNEVEYPDTWDVYE